MSSNITDKFSVKYVKPMASSKEYQKIINKDIFPATCFCNYKTQEAINRKIYQRNIPNEKQKIVVDYRPSFKVCQDYRNLNESYAKRPARLQNKIEIKEGFTSNFYDNNKKSDNYDMDLVSKHYRDNHRGDREHSNEPNVNKWNHAARMWANDQRMMKSIEQDKNAIAPKLNYLRDIDIDSNLRQGFLHSECPDKRFKPKLCETVTVNNPTILENPYCENYKSYKFNDDTQEHCPYTVKVSKNTKKQYRGHDTPDESILQFNYRNSNVTCNDELQQTDKLSNLKQPVLFQSCSDMKSNTMLPVGPERSNHKLENIWNNVTKRKGI